MIEAIHEKSQACAACSLEKSSIIEMQIFLKIFFLKDHRAAHQLSRVLCVCKDIPWIPFLEIFSWNIQCLKSETDFLSL